MLLILKFQLVELYLPHGKQRDIKTTCRKSRYLKQ